MEAITLRQSRGRLPSRQVSWQSTAAGLLALLGLWNVAQAARINRLEVTRLEMAAQLLQAEQARDRALEKLEKMTIQSEQLNTVPVAYEVVGSYQYIGECTITSYCPCEECCGQWADGLTATGIPAVPGVVAVDPEVIPLGSTVVIGGQRYLAADTGVTGKWIDICAAEHQDAEDFGVQTMAVWVETEGGHHG